RDVSGPASLSMQPVMFNVSIYPGCGDVTNAGPYGSTTTATFRQLLGSEAAGTVINPGSRDTAGETVNLLTSPGSENRGSDSPDGPGFFATGSPWGRGGTGGVGYRPGNQGANHVVKLGDGLPVAQKQFGPRLFFQRERVHVRFFGSPKSRKGRNVDSLSHPHLGWWGRASVLGSGTELRWNRTTGPVRKASDVGPATSITSAAEGERISSPSVALVQAYPGEQIICLFEKSVDAAAASGGTSGIYETLSADDGETWEVPTMAFPGGQTPVIARPADGDIGGILRSAFIPGSESDVSASVPTGSRNDGAGTILGDFRFPGERTPGATFTFLKEDGTPLVVTGDGYHLAQLHEGQARWILSCIAEGENEFSDWTSAEEGRTWTRLV
ncbi:MAG: hypothetical protein H8F28_03565, partial [Fibrella sp.]|nr:hypothetical protein [Armatimonadota bacterium]